MQNEIVDKKIQVIFDNYKDSLYAKNAQEEVEQLRRKAIKLGAGISTVAFVGNEMARLTMRSRKFYFILTSIFFSPLQIENSECRFLALDANLHGQISLPKLGGQENRKYVENSQVQVR